MKKKSTLDIDQLEQRIRLLSRQVREYKALLLEQKQARRLLREQFNQQFRSLSDIGQLRIELTTLKASQLAILFSVHIEKQQSMFSRHQQELAELEATIRTQQNGLRSDLVS